eukprot:Clim_evm30s155 gene=Clim_evmTU30s155
MVPSDDSVLSSRGQRALGDVASYFGKFVEAGADPYHVETSPEGYIIFAVAANKLVWPAFQAKLAEVTKAVPDWVGDYTGMRGHPEFREVIAKWMTRYMAKGTYTVDAESLALSSGCGAVVHNVFWALCEDGDAVILPTPAYPAFDNDLAVMSNLHLYYATTVAPEFKVTEECLEAAVQKAKAEGRRVRALLISTPNNPIGHCYSAEEMRMMVRFCRRLGIHFVSDEIYASSVYRKPPVPYVSLFEVCKDEGGMGNDMHVIWGFSKDFAVNGLRVGCVASECKPLLKAYDNLGYFFTVSNLTQYVLTEMLKDEKWTDEYLKQCNASLLGNYELISNRLKGMGIPFFESFAGQFLCIDMRQYLPEPSWKGEDQLFTTLFEECKLLLTPGEACHFDSPGFFRICFAWLSPEAVTVGMDRLEDWCAKQAKA